MTSGPPTRPLGSQRVPWVVFGLHGLQPQGALAEATVETCLGYVRAMADHARALVAGVCVDPSLDADWLTKLLPAGLPVVSGAEIPPVGRSVVFHALSLLAERPMQSLWPTWARASSVALVVSVHDDLTRQALEAPAVDAQGRLDVSRHRLLARADAVVATSHAAALDVIGWAGANPERVFVAHESVRRPEPGDDAIRPPRIDGFDVNGEFLVSPASTASSMHTENIVRAFARLCRRLPGRQQLVLASTKGGCFDSRLLADLGVDVDGRVIVATGISPGELEWLYRSCMVTVIGGVEAGSSGAVLEAAAGGSGVVVADHDALIELVVEPDARFYPTSVDSVASMLRRCLTDREFCRARRKETARGVAGYSDSGTAEALSVVYRRAVARRPRRALAAPAASR